ncbi:MAG: hypothetical protein J3K34DRAFT_494434 [Monoraphidium minutum]|nr:MAG: hypothetical protein J3K34DRAFT_494434 [Monoraphidium minutum]
MPKVSSLTMEATDVRGDRGGRGLGPGADGPATAGGVPPPARGTRPLDARGARPPLGGPPPPPGAAAAAPPPPPPTPPPPPGAASCGLLLGLPRADEASFWRAPPTRLALAWDAAGAAVAFLNTRSLGRSRQMAHLAPGAAAYRAAMAIVMGAILLQLCALAAAPRAYRRARGPVMLFNRLLRSLVHALFLVRPFAPPVPPPPPPGWPAGDLLSVALFAAPLSFAQQPLLFVLPARWQAPIAGASLLMFTRVWLPRSLRALLRQPRVVGAGACAHAAAALAAANSAMAAVHGAPLHAPAAVSAPLAPGCCRCVLEGASVFAALCTLVLPTLLAWRWEFRAKADFELRARGRRLQIRAAPWLRPAPAAPGEGGRAPAPPPPRGGARGAAAALAERLLCCVDACAMWAVGRGALLPLLLALPVLLFWASESLVAYGECAGACAPDLAVSGA